LLSRLLGVYRDHLLAVSFGASANLDAYYAAFRVPDLIYALLIMSSISVVFLPMFQQYKLKENESQKNLTKAWQFTSKILNSLSIFFIFVIVGVIILAPFLVDVYVAGFSATQKEFTVKMMRVMILSPLFFMISSVMIAVQNAWHKFLAQALSPIVYNLGIIFGIYYLTPTYGTFGLALGVVIGACGQMLIQIPSFLSTGFKWSASFLSKSELLKMIKILIPRILSVSAVQLALTVDTILGAALTAGSITFLNLAINIQSLPFGMIVISISITSFASLTKLAAKNDRKKFQQELRHSLSKTLFWLIPAVVGLYLILNPLLDFLFVYGKFSTENTVVLSQLIQILLIALLFQGVIPLLSRAFFAQQKTWLPFYLSLIGLILNIFTSIYLSQKIGVYGLAWGTVVGLSVNALLLIIFSYKKFGSILSFQTLLKTVCLSAVMFLFLQFGVTPLLNNLDSWQQLVILITSGGSLYLASEKLFFIFGYSSAKD
jgi:putative peptidoglycan lipid II flippase